MIVNKCKTMGDVRIAAWEYGMSVDDFMYDYAMDLDGKGIDWNNDEPSESLDDRLERLDHEIGVFAKYGCEIPDRLLTAYYEVLDKWTVKAAEEYERLRDAMENAPIGPIEDWATEEDFPFEEQTMNA